MRLVYIAGPFTARPEQIDEFLSERAARNFAARQVVKSNIDAAVRFGIEVAKLGACPWMPTVNTGHPTFETLNNYEFWIEATLLQLSRCDAVLMMPNWEQSKGATGEHFYAREHGIPVFYCLEQLAEWLRNPGGKLTGEYPNP